MSMSSFPHISLTLQLTMEVKKGNSDDSFQHTRLERTALYQRETKNEWQSFLFIIFNVSFLFLFPKSGSDRKN